jgi:hypothetical protein
LREQPKLLPCLDKGIDACVEPLVERQECCNLTVQVG